MSTHKAIDKICCVSLAVAIALTVLFMNADSLGLQAASAAPGYETRLFDTSRVHSIDVIMDDWDEFTANCQSEEYSPCAVVIDGEAYKNVAIRAKGNTSLTQVAAYGNDRYSFKIEFDHYDGSGSYYGLDKLCLNNLIQDNTYMKDYLCYRLMNEMGVASPLCSYVYITVNGEDWGLYLAVEGVEEAFLRRNYGTDYGNLYKPDSLGMGGGRGNGMDFDISDFMDAGGFLPGGNGGGGSSPGAAAPGLQPSGGGPGDIRSPGGESFGGGMMSGSDDVLLKYIDDDFDSYSNIFDNAKTDVTSSDKARLIESLKRLSSGEGLESTVDIEAVIRYFVVHNFVLNFDSYTGSMIHNYYLYEKDGQLQMIPWDYNLAFGGFESAGGAEGLVNYPIDSPVSGGNAEDRPMIAWIFNSEEYTALYHQYFSEFISEFFDSGYFESTIDSVAEMISPYVEKDPTKFCTYEEFQTGVSTLREFCLLRAESIAGQLNGTIGSTSQTQDGSTLISAGDLQISDMGSMNNSMGGDMPSMPDNAGGDMPSLPDNAGGDVPSLPDNAGSDMPSTPDNAGGDAPSLPDNSSGDVPSLPDNAGGDAPSMPDNSGGDAPSMPDNPGGDVPSLPDNAGGDMPSTPDNAGGDVPSMPDNTGGNAPSMPDNAGGNAPSLPDNAGGDMPSTPDNAGGNMPSMPNNAGSDAPTMPDNAGGDVPSMPDNAGGNAPSMPDNAAQGSGALQTLQYGGVSLAVLLAGLVFALFYRRRK